MAKARYDQWRQLPTQWVKDGELKKLTWLAQGSDAIVALMVFLVMSHKRSLSSDGSNNSTVQVTYDELQTALNVSRSKISGGISILLDVGWIKKEASRSHFTFTAPSVPWGKVPVRPLYDNHNAIFAFDSWRLRNPLELDALKLYFVLITFRDSDLNYASISYERLRHYSGVQKIKSALNFLVASTLIYIEREAPNPYGNQNPPNMYRIRGVDSYKHNGTNRDPSRAQDLSQEAPF